VDSFMKINAAVLLVNIQTQPAQAMPMVLTEEFEIIARDSARSIQVVEFAGTAGEVVTVRLVDGTVFGLSDVVESSYDPRSPLKVKAICRQFNVPTKFLVLDAVLATTPKKKKVYMNKIVQKAAEKQELKKERMKQDEEERLAALYKIEEEEAKKKFQRAAKQEELKKQQQMMKLDEGGEIGAKKEETEESK